MIYASRLCQLLFAASLAMMPPAGPAADRPPGEPVAEEARPRCLAAESLGEHLLGAFEETLLFGLELDVGSADLCRLADEAPELAVALLAQRLEDGKAPPVNQRHAEASAVVLPSRAFVEAILQGRDDEKTLTATPLPPLPKGTILRIDTRAERLPGNRAWMRLRSSLVDRSDLSVKQTLHEWRADLIRVGSRKVPVQGYPLARAEVYTLQGLERIRLP